MNSTRHGFTLVELSIVLVIIGLIIGGVLTGQQIIQNARITNAVNAIQAFQAQFQTYAQNYGALPGDDANAETRFPSATLGGSNLGGNGDGNGIVGTDASFDVAATQTAKLAGESLLVWAHLRAAGLVKNQMNGNSTAVQPPNPFNGIYGFQNGAFAGVFTTTVLCLNQVPAAAAQAIDARLDDGLSDAGTVQATTISGAGSGGGAVAANYGVGQNYSLCVRM